MWVGFLCPCANHIRDKASPLACFNLRVSHFINARFNNITRLGDTPFDSAVDGAFFLGLAGMEWLDRISIIMAHHTERIDRLAPFLFLQMANGFSIPSHRRIARAAPFTFTHMQDVVFEILEDRIGRFCAF